MTATMMMKIAEAKKMMGAEQFCPTDYENARWHWDAATPAWATLKKYATEAGLVAEEVAYEWHGDGSMLAALCGIAEGTVFYHTMYSFKG